MLFYFYYRNVMKDLIKQKHICYVFIYKQLLVLAKEIFICLLIGLIFVFYYYICVHIYSSSNDNSQLTTIYITSIEELKPINQPNMWYKNFVGDFFEKFTSNSKAINPKFMQVKFEVKTLIPLEHNLSIEKKSIILSKIQSDCIKSLISECEFYKNKTSLLEIQLLNTKIAYHNLIKDIDDITKEMNYLFKKP